MEDGTSSEKTNMVGSLKSQSTPGVQNWSVMSFLGGMDIERLFSLSRMRIAYICRSNVYRATHALPHPQSECC